MIHNESTTRLLLLSCILVGTTAAIAVEPPVTAVTIAPDGQSVIVGSQAGVAVHSWPGLRLERSLRTSVRNVHDLRFSPDGASIAIAGGEPSEQGTLEVLDWPSGRSSFRTDEHEDSILSVAWQSDTRLATASLDQRILVWELGASRPVRQLAGHSRGVTGVCFLPDRPELLVSSGIDQIVRVWNVDNGELVRSLNNHTKPIHALAAWQSGSGLSMLASVSDDGTVRFWQPSIGRMVRFARMECVPLAVDWLPNRSRIVVTSIDGRVRLIDPETVTVTEQPSGIEGWAYSVAVHPSDESIVVGGRRGQLRRVVLNQSE